MRRAIPCIVVAALLLAVGIPAAHAGASFNISVGLPFPVVTPVVVQKHKGHGHGHYRHHAVIRRPVIYAPAAIVYTPPAPVVYSPPIVYQAPVPVVASAPYPTVVHYPHGRYELRVDRGRYVWVWIANTPDYAPAPYHYQ